MIARSHGPGARYGFPGEAPERGPRHAKAADRSTLAGRSTASIVREVAAYVSLRTCVEPEAILGKGRTKRVAAARHDVCVELRALGFSYPEIGHELGRDHTTIMSAVRAAEARGYVAAYSPRAHGAPARAPAVLPEVPDLEVPRRPTEAA